MSTLLRPPGLRESDDWEWVCDYVYCHESGEEWFRKKRYRLLHPEWWGRGKTFRYSYRGRAQKPPYADSCLYILDELHVASLRVKFYGADEPVWWAEGEKDVHSLLQAGVLATTHHQGAGHATLEQAATLTFAGRIFLVADKDPAGAYDAARRWDLLWDAGFPESRLSIVKAREGKDASDHLAAGYGPDEFAPVDMDKLVRLAQGWQPARSGRGYRPWS